MPTVSLYCRRPNDGVRTRARTINRHDDRHPNTVIGTEELHGIVRVRHSCGSAVCGNQSPASRLLKKDVEITDILGWISLYPSGMLREHLIDLPQRTEWMSLTRRLVSNRSITGPVRYTK